VTPGGSVLEPRASDTLLFAYGTLRRGGRHHRWIATSVRWLGPARLCGLLYDLGRYPGAQGSADPAHVVHGDLFAVRASPVERFLVGLDRFEGSEYRRERVEVTRADGRAVSAWTYLFASDPSGLRRIESGDFLGDLRERSELS